MTRIIETVAEIAGDYDAMLCDLWGCYHDGLSPYPAAVAALRAFRAAGGTVILLTNAPRPSGSVARHLAGMGAPSDSFDAIVSSGDAARFAVADGRFGRRVEHVGPARDLPFFDGLEIERVARDQAESVVVTGLYDDEIETPDDYAEAVREWRARGLRMLCANPDVLVDRGDRRLWCAGAIAGLYELEGGEVAHAGKPHDAIYELARKRLDEIRGPGAHRILALGDGVATDVAGAAAQGLDAVFVTGGLAAEETSDDPESPDPDRLAAFLERSGAAPAFAIGRLR